MIQHTISFRHNIKNTITYLTVNHYVYLPILPNTSRHNIVLLLFDCTTSLSVILRLPLAFGNNVVNTNIFDIVTLCPCSYKYGSIHPGRRMTLEKGSYFFLWLSLYFTKYKFCQVTVNLCVSIFFYGKIYNSLNICIDWVQSTFMD